MRPSCTYCRYDQQAVKAQKQKRELESANERCLTLERDMRLVRHDTINAAVEPSCSFPLTSLLASIVRLHCERYVM